MLYGGFALVLILLMGATRSRSRVLEEVRMFEPLLGLAVALALGAYLVSWRTHEIAFRERRLFEVSALALPNASV
jgi:hypothetical protein